MGEVGTTYPLMEGLRFAELLEAVQALGLFGAKSKAVFWMDDFLTSEVGLWLTRGLRLLALGPAEFGEKIDALTPTRLGVPHKKYLEALQGLEGLLARAGLSDAPLGTALSGLLERYPGGR